MATATLEPAAPSTGAPELTPTSGARGDVVFRYLALAAGLIVFVVLGLIAVTMTLRALPAFTEQGPSFLWSSEWLPNDEIFGALGFIYGTVIISVIALILAVPVSIGIALFITEVAPKWLKTPAIYVIDLLSAIPSVVYGLWGIIVFVPFVLPYYDDTANFFSGVPVLGTIFNGNPVSGQSFMTAGIILAFMVTPIVTSITREVYATVPQDQKNAALALGATRWEMIRATVFPYSRSGTTGAVILGLGRAMGETIAAALVIGSSVRITAELFSTGDAMAAVIANSWGEATDLYRSALIGLGVVLFAMTIVVNFVAQSIINRSAKHGDAGV